MHINFGYYGNFDEDIFDTTKPLLVTSAGHYIIDTQKIRETKRPKGRKDWQIIYVADAHAEFWIHGEKLIVPKGNIVIIRPDEPQLYYLYAKDKPETYWAHFTGYDIENILKKYNIPENKNVFFVGNSSDISYSFLRMIKELQMRQSYFEDVLTTCLMQIFLIIGRYIKEEKFIKNHMLDEIERAANYFRENYDKNIIIEEYAASRNMSPCWFIQNFKEITRYTPMQYIIYLRITNSMNLLDTTNDPVSKIAVNVGYDNSLYFSRLFKNHTGMSPSQYRKRSKMGV